MKFPDRSFFFIIAKWPISLMYFFLNYSLYSRCFYVKDRLYSLWLSNSIKKIDITSKIGCDCLLIGGEYITIGKNTSMGRHGILTCWDNYIGEKYYPSIEIGDNCSIGEYCHITSINSIVIGNNVLTGRWVTITDNGHGETTKEHLEMAPTHRPLFSKGKVVIDDNVWIGDKATILAGVHIGMGAVIAANSVVTKDVPSFSVVGGNPAKVLKQL